MQKYRRFLRFFLHVSEKCSNFVRFLVRNTAKAGKRDHDISKSRDLDMTKKQHYYYKNTNLWQTTK